MRVLTKDEMIKAYSDCSLDVALLISKLNNYKQTFEDYMKQEGHNGDDVDLIVESIEKLGLLLAVLTIYKDETSQ